MDLYDYSEKGVMPVSNLPIYRLKYFLSLPIACASWLLHDYCTSAFPHWLSSLHCSELPKLFVDDYIVLFQKCASNPQEDVGDERCRKL